MVMGAAPAGEVVMVEAAVAVVEMGVEALAVAGMGREERAEVQTEEG